MSAGNAKEIVTMLTIRLCSADQMIFVAEASAGRRIVVTVLTKIERAPFGAPTPEEITHDQIAKQHFLKYCDGVKCIRGSAHSLKANWHNGFCTECAFNPYNMAAEAALEEMGVQ